MCECPIEDCVCCCEGICGCWKDGCIDCVDMMHHDEFDWSDEWAESEEYYDDPEYNDEVII